MYRLTDQQRNTLKEFLRQQGLTFKPLLDEMVDHVTCDLEERMAQGSSYEEAWSQAIGEIPDNHFYNIQKETMETINKRFTVSQGLSYLALVLLFASVVFKVQHWPLAGELLLLSFGAIAASLLTASVFGIYLNKEKKGAFRVIAVITGIIILMIGYSFRILHFPGANEIVILAVIVLLISMLMNTLYVYEHASGEGNLMTFLHEKYTPGIERFFLVLMLPLIIYKIIAIVVKPDHFFGNLILLIVIPGTGLQLIALCWRSMEKDLINRNPIALTLVMLSIICLILPFLGENLHFQVRVVIVLLFTIVAGVLAYQMEGKQKVISLLMVVLIPLIFLGWALVRLNLIPVSADKLLFNLPVLMILLAGVLIMKKNGLMRTYLMISLASYLFEYPIDAGLF